ncbi:MAG TPA: hypothetical protein VF131_06440 [Blastocatellia bacterium]|nr:hypothetical protein [Blastocatellia bacterium]
MKSKVFWTLSPVIVSLVLASTGCLAGKRLFGDSGKSVKTVTSTDGRSQLSVPGNWKTERTLSEGAELQVSDRANEMYVVVLSESKADFDNITIDKHAELTRGIVLGNLSSPQTTTPVKITINGRPALQNEIRGAVEKTNLVYLHTTVETPKYFHQIVAWTLPSRFDKNREKLQEVVRSFKETGSAP